MVSGGDLSEKTTYVCGLDLISATSAAGIPPARKAPCMERSLGLEYCERNVHLSRTSYV